MAKNKQAGFTMVEMLFSLSVVLTFVFFFSLIIGALNIKDRTAELEMETMFQQLAKDVRKSINIDTYPKALILVNVDGEELMFEQYSNVLRKRVERQGHEIIATQIENVRFYKKRKGVVVEVIHENGKMYRRRLSQIPFIGRSESE